MGGQSGGDVTNPWDRHPTCDVNIGANSDSHSNYTSYWNSARSSRVQVMSNTGTVPAVDNTPSCMSCHKAHGSTHPDGLIWDNSTTATLEDGTYLRDTCQQCHDK
jgi:predicted CXXCH cytochrome family protein